MKFAPREIFEQILEWAVVPTFDLIIEVEGKGFVFVKRKIAPYKDQWALPGLRIYKGESIDEALIRIAKQEVGITLDPASKKLLGQYMGKFKTEHNRQDLSTGYHVILPPTTEILLNSEHFSAYEISYDVPQPVGAMYKFYIDLVKA